MENFKILLEITEPLNQTQFDAAIAIRNQLLLHTSITNVKITGICFVRPVFKHTTLQIFCRSDGRWAANNEIVRFAQTA